MQFLYPSFLWALAAVSIPIVIHLFQFRRYKTVYFSNVNFLKQVQQESTSSSKLKHLLVLAARILAVICLVMAFAQPFIPKRTQQAATGKSYVSIYIDNSFSMNRVQDGFTLLDKAKQTAAEIAKGYNDDDRFQLLTNEFKGNSQRLISKEELLASVEEVSFSAASRNLQEVGKQQSEILATENGATKTAYLISDFQKGMESGFSPDTSVKFNLVPQASQSVSNLYIDSCWFYEPVQLVGQSNTLIVRIKNSGENDISEGRLSMKLNGQSKAISDFDVAAEGYTLDTIQFTNEKAGWNLAELSLADNEVVFDDNYFTSFKVLDKVNVLNITDGNPNRFMAAVFSKNPQFGFETLPQSGLNFEQLKNYNFIALTNLNQIPSGLAAALAAYVTEGGSLAVFPAYQSDIASYNKLFTAVGVQNIENFSDAATEASQPNIQQNIFKDVFEKAPENIRLPAVKRYALFTQSISPTKEDILQTREGNTLVARYSHKSGSVYISAVSADEQNSDLTVNALFAPMLYKMAVLNAGTLSLQHTIGYKTIVPVNTTTSKDNVLRIANAKKEFIPQQYNSGNQTIVVVSNDIDEAGFYNITRPNNDTALAVVGTNYSRAESIMKYFSPDELKTLFNSYPNVHVFEENVANIGKQVQTLDKATLLWKYFLIAALLFLATEILLLRFWKR